MNEVKTIRQILLTFGIDSVEVVESKDPNSSFYVFVDAEYDNDGLRVPNESAVRKIERQLDALDMDVNVVILDPELDIITRILRTRVLKDLANDIELVYLSQRKNTLFAFVRLNYFVALETKDKIFELVQQYLKIVGYESQHIVIDSFANTPSLTTILAKLRTMSPCMVEDLMENLEKDNIGVPSVKWISGRLDALRREQLVLRNSSGEFFLTLKGLGALGTQKNRNSPDIRRALTLAQRCSRE